MANGVETILIASLFTVILNTGVSTGALESATLTVLSVCESPFPWSSRQNQSLPLVAHFP